MTCVGDSAYSGMKQKVRLFVLILLLSGCVPLLFYLMYEDTVQPPVKQEVFAVPQGPAQRNNKRQQSLNKACWKQKKKRKIIPIFSPPIKANVYVEPVHNVFYCPVQKAGSSFWMRTLTAMRSDQFSNPYQMNLQHHNLMYHTSWKKVMPQEQVMQVLKTAFSFMFVREPYGRLFSAYVDKVYYPNKVYWPEYTKGIARAAGRKSSRGYDVSFRETVKHILKLAAEDPGSIDMHFKPMHMLCDPCNVYYKFLGKLETFEEDVEYLLAFFKTKYRNFNIKFEDLERESVLDDITRHVNMLFYMIETYKFPSEINRFKILQRGWSDLHIRGYLSKHIPLPFIDSQARSVTKDMFMKAIKDAQAIPVDTAAVKRQRTEAMVQAYNTIPMDDLKKLRTMLRPDCQLFEYNCMPDILFKRDTKHQPDAKHVFLKGF